MRKNIFFLMLATFTLLPLSMSGQVKSAGLKSENKSNALSVLPTGQQNLGKKYPAWIGTRSMKSGPFAEVTPITPRLSSAPNLQRLLTTAGGSEIWGNVVYADSWSSSNSPYGIYNLGTTNALSVSAIATGSNMQATGGGAYYDGFFHYIYRYSSYGNIYATYYMYDMENWTQSASSDITNYSLIAMDETYDATTGKVYGIFFNSALTGFELGIIDYSSLSRTTVSKVDSVFLCLAADNSGQLYGITSGGTLYRINKTTGSVQEVGKTGVVPEQVIQSATFDPRTNVLYWAACKSDGTAYLMTVDTTTGKATDVAQFPDNQEVVALYIPAPDAADGAPSKITDLTQHFDNGSLSGNITFTIPSTTYGGETLSGNVEYDIVINDGDTIRGTAAAGEAVTYTTTLQRGQTEVVVQTKNDTGLSPRATINFWAGQDNPQAVQNLKLVISEDNKTATLTWDAPSEVGTHNGYVDVANLKYRVIRYPGTITVAEAQTATSLTDVVPDSAVNLIYYQVTAFNGEWEGTPAESNDIAAGDAFTPPYLEDFSSADSWGLFSIINANNDDGTWEYNRGDQDASYWYNDTNTGDDWLITPPIRLSTERSYNFSFKTRCQDASTPERLAVYYGMGSDVTSYTEIVPPTVIDYTTFKTIENIIKVDKAGDYRFAFHAISDPDTYMLHIDDISVQPLAVFTAPDSVTNLTVSAGNKGALSAAIKFTTPVKTTQGTRLSAITKVEVYRNTNTLVKTFDAPATGTELEFTDTGNGLSEGTTTYTIVPYNETGDGVKTSRTVYIGKDIPSFPENVTLTETGDGEYTLTWTAPKQGQNGGYVDSTEVVYYVFAKDGTKILASGLTDKSYVLSVPDTAQTQELLYYGVAAQTNQGRSDVANSNIIIVGKPYTLPFHESFPNGQFEYSLWWRSRSGNNTFNLASSPTVDNDGGSAYWYAAAAGDMGSLNSGKISLQGAANPKLVFSYYAFPGQQVKIDVLADVEGKSTQEIGVVDYSTLTGNTGWRKVILPIPETLADAKYIALRFRCTSEAVQVPVIIDNINVLDVLANNIAASISAPSRGTVGKAVSVRVGIENIGDETATDFKVNLYANDKLVASQDGGSIETMESQSYTFSYTPTVIDGESVTFYAVAEYADDLDEDDNTTARTTATIAQPTYPAISDLTGTTSDGTTNLTWSEPQVSENKVTEDFESYEPFIIDGIGDWTLVDGDKARTYGIEGLQYDHQNDAKAFMTFNPAQLGIDLDQYDFFKPHSGNQILASFATVSGHNDDWLISPELSGKEQTISFWAKALMSQYSPEKIQVLYSTTTQDTASFVLLKNYDITATWTEISETVPVGAKYFAVRVVTEDQLMLMLDDVTYVGRDLVVSGYNVYRDGELVGTVPAGTTSYADNTTDGHVYYVTVVYNVGESSLSNAYQSDATAINGITADLSTDVTVFSTNGAVVGRGSKALRTVPDGVYVIRDNTTGKVLKVVKK